MVVGGEGLGRRELQELGPLAHSIPIAHMKWVVPEQQGLLSNFSQYKLLIVPLLYVSDGALLKRISRFENSW
jgi:hypothetical protein